MPTAEETKLLCIMHICITLECIYQLSPGNRVDINRPLAQSSIFPLQMLQVHFENMVNDNYPNPDDCRNVYMTLHQIAINNPSYKNSDYLQSIIIKSIESLLDTPHSTKWWPFISGYSTWIPQGPLNSFIGKWLLEKDRSLGILWGII